MMTEETVRAMIRGTETPSLIPPEPLPWEVADGDASVEVTA